jgi:hypothetical protein
MHIEEGSIDTITQTRDKNNYHGIFNKPAVQDSRFNEYCTNPPKPLQA